ncbi:MAG TPA: (Fe-S)-binding protein, partial [Candidatus Wallbacteria bacterium]|nr:(Fe-S)-binding protein [Candidatus Wallbacteria bacterium]
MSEILISILVMGAIAIFLAILLIWSSKKFYVAENPLIEEVAALLPQANCGACGYPGCAGFAKVLVETRDTKMICPVSPPEKLKEIGRIAGIEIDDKKPMIAVLHCNGTHDNAKIVSEYIGVRSCVAAHNLYTGDKECIYSCIGYGDCVKACLFGAIRTEN